jgi:hypothetical protein
VTRANVVSCACPDCGGTLRVQFDDMVQDGPDTMAIRPVGFAHKNPVCDAFTEYTRSPDRAVTDPYPMRVLKSLGGNYREGRPEPFVKH